MGNIRKELQELCSEANKTGVPSYNVWQAIFLIGESIERIVQRIEDNERR